jgi:hypothetical protein
MDGALDTARKAKKPPMDESEVLNSLNSQIDRAKSFHQTKISPERALAYDYYYGKPFGNEVKGRSQVVSADVAQVIDSAVPALVKIFVAGDDAVEFAPRGPEDVEHAELATKSANYVFFTQNTGFQITHDVIKDGLLQKTGAVKWRWDTSIKVSEKTYFGLDDTQMEMLDSDPSIEIIAHGSGIVLMADQPMTMHNVTVKQSKEVGQIAIDVIPPEELLISPDAMNLDPYKMPFIGHAPFKTASELLEMGVPQEVIDDLPGSESDDLYAEERIAREARLDSTALTWRTTENPDPSQKMYRYYECYMRIDEDGDGIAELRKICKVGETIVDDEIIDHIPMCVWTPKVMPHEVVGISLADDVMDLQLLKSTIWRSALDNMYLTNSPRQYVDMNMNVNLDDVLTVRPGGIIRGYGPNGVTPQVIPFTAQYAFQALEYADQEEEVRTGISRLFQGIDPQAINKTATGVNALIEQANARVELIARNIAEYIFKPMFKGILYLLGKHQQQPLMVRLFKKFVPIDPQAWQKEYDMTVNVGLGTGTKQQQLMQMQAMGQDYAMVMQSPFASQLMTPKNVYNYLTKKTNLLGFKNVDDYWTDPDTVPPPEPQPPPEIQKAQMQIEADKEKQAAQMQMDQQKMQQDSAQKEKDALINAELTKYKAQLQAEVEVFKAQLKAQVDAQIGMMNAQANAQRPIYEGRPE